MLSLTFMDVIAYIQRRQVLRKSSLPGSKKLARHKKKTYMQSKLLDLSFVCGISENQMQAICFLPLLYLKLLGASARDDLLPAAASCSAFRQAGG